HPQHPVVHPSDGAVGHAGRAVVGATGGLERRAALNTSPRVVPPAGLGPLQGATYALDGEQVGPGDGVDVVVRGAGGVTAWLGPVGAAVDVPTAVESLRGGHDDVVVDPVAGGLQLEGQVDDEGLARCHP